MLYIADSLWLTLNDSSENICGRFHPAGRFKISGTKMGGSYLMDTPLRAYEFTWAGRGE